MPYVLRINYNVKIKIRSSGVFGYCGAMEVLLQAFMKLMQAIHLYRYTNGGCISAAGSGTTAPKTTTAASNSNL